MKKIFLLYILLTSIIIAQLDEPDGSTIALYLFNTGTGDTLYDVSDNNLHGILKSGATWHPEGGISFSNGAYVEIPHNELLNPKNESWTIEAVIRTKIDVLNNESPTNTNSLLTKNDGDFSNGYNIHFDWEEQTVHALIDDSTNTPFNFSVGTPFTFTEWDNHHIAFVYDKNANKLKIYLDNVLGETIDTELKEITSSAPLYIGKYEQISVGYTQYFFGVVKKLKFSNIAKDPSDFILTNINNHLVHNTLPGSFKVDQNYPNPFNPTTTISYSIPKSGYVTLKVYNILGKEISTLVNKKETAGNYQITFDAKNLPSGAYIYRLSSNNNTLSKIMILQK